jgi:acyl dehydratase
VPLNQDCVGRSYEATGSFEVSREHIRIFADAIGDRNPAYRDRDAARALGHPDVIAPPTFLTTVGLSLATGGGGGPLSDPDLGLDFTRVVHGQQRFVHHRPVVPGDVLRMRTTVESIRAAGSNEFLSMRDDIIAADGEVVCTAYNLVVSRGTAAG